MHCIHAQMCIQKGCPDKYIDHVAGIIYASTQMRFYHSCLLFLSVLKVLLFGCEDSSC